MNISDTLNILRNNNFPNSIPLYTSFSSLIDNNIAVGFPTVLLYNKIKVLYSITLKKVKKRDSHKDYPF